MIDYLASGQKRIERAAVVLTPTQRVGLLWRDTVLIPCQDGERVHVSIGKIIGPHAVVAELLRQVMYDKASIWACRDVDHPGYYLWLTDMRLLLTPSSVTAGDMTVVDYAEFVAREACDLPWLQAPLADEPLIVAARPGRLDDSEQRCLPT